MNVKAKKHLLLLSVACMAWRVRRRKKRFSWIRDWIARRPILGFSELLVRELAMFRMDMKAFKELLGVVDNDGVVRKGVLYFSLG